MTLSNGDQRGPPAPPEGVDAICDVFEAAWLAGQEPRIEDFLPGGEPVHQDVLLQELLLAEWDLRRRHEQHVELQTYLQRFAESGQFVAELWHVWQAKQAEGSLDGRANGLATAPHSPPSVELGTIIGRYKLLEKLGEGGFGTVWVAEQREPVKRRVALKVIKLGMDTRQVVARFEAERQALALMDHPNIAKVLDAGATETGGPYFVMELVRGIPITNYCDQGRLPTQDRLNLFMKVCHAIQHAHQKGIIHRDIKPSNILVTLHDGVPVPKVIDFGIAKAIQQELTAKTIYTQLAQFIGTPAYMSPEQAEMSGLDIDTRSDIYSLGVLLYELLTGATPFDANELMRSGLDEMRKIIREREPLTPSSRLTKDLQTKKAGRAQSVSDLPRAAIDRDLDWIVMKCLEKDRARRYETAIGLARDVERYLRDEPVEACPPSVWYRFRKFARRHKTALAAAGLVTTLLVAAVAVLSVSNARVRSESTARALALQEKDAALQEKVAALKDRDQALELAREKESLERSRYYAAQMNLASQAWKSGQSARAAELLETLRPRTGEVDLREFEWYYLYRQAHPNLLRQWRAHWRRVHDLALTADGALLITAGADGQIRVWDAVTGECRGNLACYARNVRSDHSSPWSIDVSDDGKTLAAADSSGEVTLWDFPALRERIRWMAHPVANGVRKIVFSPDGKLLAAEANGVSLFSAADGKLVANLPVHIVNGETWLNGLEFSPDGKTLASSAPPWRSNPSIIHWNLTPTPKKKWELPNVGSNVLVYSADGQTLWATREQDIVAIDPATGESRETLKGHTGRVNDIALDADTRQLASSSEDNTTRLWDLTTGDSVLLNAGLADVAPVSIDPLGRFVASGDDNGWITCQSLKVQDANRTYRSPSWVHSIVFMPDSRSLIVGRWPGQWVDVDTLEQRYIGIEGNTLAVSSDAKLAAVYDDKSRLTIWNLEAQSNMTTIEVGAIDRAAFTPDGKRVATWDAWEGRELRLWEIDTGKQFDRVQVDGDAIIAAAFSPTSDRLALGVQWRTVAIYDLHKKTVVGRRNASDDISSVSHVAYSPDGSMLAVAPTTGMVALFDVAENPPHLRWRDQLRGHSEEVTAMAFSPDGRTLATAGADHSLRLWNVSTGQERSTIDADARLLAFSPDGDILARVDNEDAVHFLDARPIPSARAVRTWLNRTDPDSPDQLMSAAYSAWDARDMPQAEKRLVAAVQTLETEMGPLANDLALDLMVRCKLYLHLLQSALNRQSEAQQSLDDAKKLLAEAPDHLKHFIASRYIAQGPKSAEKDQLTDALFPWATRD